MDDYLDISLHGNNVYSFTSISLVAPVYLIMWTYNLLNCLFCSLWQVTIEGGANTFHCPSRSFSYLGLGGAAKSGLSKREQTAGFSAASNLNIKLTIPGIARYATTVAQEGTTDEPVEKHQYQAEVL
jgi:hypothetical protein